MTSHRKDSPLERICRIGHELRRHVELNRKLGSE